MFKKIILFIFGVVLITACAKPASNPTDADSGKIILVGMVSLTPALDDDGNMVKNLGDNSMVAFLEFLLGGKSEFIRIGTNRYFAIAIPADENIILNEIQFVIKNRRPESKTEQFYHSFLTNRQFMFGAKPIAGQVYYLGNIDIKLSEISFNEDIVNPKAQYIIARDINLVNNLTGAQAWFFNEFPMINKTVRDARTTVRMTAHENSFQNVSQDIVYTND